jgi:hypothetical protein
VFDVYFFHLLKFMNFLTSFWKISLQTSNDKIEFTINNYSHSFSSSFNSFYQGRHFSCLRFPTEIFLKHYSAAIYYKSSTLYKKLECRLFLQNKYTNKFICRWDLFFKYSKLKLFISYFTSSKLKEMLQERTSLHLRFPIS